MFGGAIGQNPARMTECKIPMPIRAATSCISSITGIALIIIAILAVTGNASGTTIGSMTIASTVLGTAAAFCGPTGIEVQEAVGRKKFSAEERLADKIGKGVTRPCSVIIGAGFVALGACAIGGVISASTLGWILIIISSVGLCCASCESSCLCCAVALNGVAGAENFR